MPGYGRIDLWLLWLCLVGSVTLVGLLVALQLRVPASPVI
jgi:hypothetical protein